ncbi:unnamed protein product [Rotaria magnacalcarata]|uniref:Uncharacterized protein n=1 Tax=Rotaria magnacalcarata TaxID=392030 RepID=A0A819U6V9_9BILA|nr:unnamed protein product [Rotaria magnacalcarata]CAF4220438.1 unnamed protein product [Rotaria magnacalcarata]
MTWVPTATQVGSQVFCVIASDNASVQSDQYCKTIFVGLSSVPLCPGATPATESLIKQIQDPTVDITTMEMTTSIGVQTSMPISSTLSSTTRKIFFNT